MREFTALLIGLPIIVTVIYLRARYMIINKMSYEGADLTDEAVRSAPTPLQIATPCLGVDYEQ